MAKEYFIWGKNGILWFQRDYIEGGSSKALNFSAKENYKDFKWMYMVVVVCLNSNQFFDRLQHTKDVINDLLKGIQRIHKESNIVEKNH